MRAKSMKPNKKEGILLTMVPSWGGRTRQFHVPLWTLRVLAVAGSTLTLMVIGGLVMFGKIASGAHSARRLGAENDSLRSQFGRLQSLEKQVVELTEANTQIRKMAGLDSYQGTEALGARPADKTGSYRPHAEVTGVRGNTMPHLVPHAGPISQQFEIGPRGESVHPGVDVAGSLGEAIIASGGGVVLKAGVDPNYGNMIILDHGGGIETVYGHASSLLVGVGDSVAEGQVIALLGNTGRSSAPHLHFEVRKEGTPVDPGQYVSEYRRRPH